MKHTRPVGLAALVALALSCTRSASPAVDDDLRFECRVEVAPLRAALLASGGSLSNIVRPTSLSDLTHIETKLRYKFVLDARRHLAIAPLPVSAPHNEYVHPVLGEGVAVLSAGGIRVVHDHGRVERVVIDAQSRAYCTTPESLRPTVRALLAMGLPPEAITVEGGPFACVESGVVKRYGQVMPVVARRVEMLGRAIAAERWELAGYAAEELAEEIEELPDAVPPAGAPVDVTPIARAFDASYLRPLEAAFAAHDHAAVRAAYATMTTGCNTCHATSGRAYLTISPTPGDPVPSMTFTPGDASAAGDASVVGSADVIARVGAP